MVSTKVSYHIPYSHFCKYPGLTTKKHTTFPDQGRDIYKSVNKGYLYMNQNSKIDNLSEKYTFRIEKFQCTEYKWKERGGLSIHLVPSSNLSRAMYFWSSMWNVLTELFRFRYSNTISISGFSLVAKRLKNVI